MLRSPLIQESPEQARQVGRPSASITSGLFEKYWWSADADAGHLGDPAGAQTLQPLLPLRVQETDGRLKYAFQVLQGPRLGWLEYVLNTPSAHRVHHAANVEYLDANFGGVLIVFDRLFGQGHTTEALRRQVALFGTLASAGGGAAPK